MTKQRKFKKIYFLLALILLLIMGYFIKTNLFPKQDRPNYITAKVTTMNIEQTVLADGTVEAYTLVDVGAQVSGQIKALYVELGDNVTKGQLIAEIDDLTQQNDLKEANETLNNLYAQLESLNAKKVNYYAIYQRQRKLIESGLGAKADYDEALADYNSALADIKALNAQIAKAKIAVSTAELNLGYTKITSPIDGVIVTTSVEEGQTVNAVQSAPTIVQVAQMDTVVIKAQISEADVINVKGDMPVYFTILGEPNTYYHSTLKKIEPAPYDYDSSSTSTDSAIYYNGLFDVPNQDHKLRISMRAQVYIVLAKVENAISIPSSALRKNEAGKPYVFVIKDNNEIISRDVTVGINNNVNVEILSGLTVGERVIAGSTASVIPTGNSNPSPPMPGF